MSCPGSYVGEWPSVHGFAPGIELFKRIRPGCVVQRQAQVASVDLFQPYRLPSLPGASGHAVEPAEGTVTHTKARSTRNGVRCIRDG